MLRKAVLAVAVLLLGLSIGLVGQGMEEFAELHVTKITLDPPSTVVRGAQVEVHARVMNTGARSADRFDIGFFYRLQGRSGSWILLDKVEGASLAPSKQDFLDVTFNIDTIDMELGTYEIRIIADLTNEIPEVDELNNELQTTMTIVSSSLGLPDLQPVELVYSSTNPGSDDDMLPWNVKTSIVNLGEEQAGPFSVVFLIDGVEFDRKYLFALPAGGSTELIGDLDPYELDLGPGSYEITVKVDIDDEVEEQDEANNEISGSLTLLSPELYPTSLVFDRSVVHLDEEIQVSAEINNSGKGPASGVEVAFYVNHVRFATETIDLLDRGLSTVVSGTLDPDKLGLTDAPAIYEIKVVVDPDNVFDELDEANNGMTRPLTILAPEPKRPEIHPESIELSPPSPAELGRADAVTVSTVIKNTGRAAADRFDVGFYYRVKAGLRWERFPCSDQASCSEITLAPGGQVKLVGTLPIAAIGPGIYEIRVLADSGNVVEELDETNDELVTTLTLLASRLPDLSFCILQPVVVEPSAQVQHGQTVRLSPCLTNIGDRDAGPFLVRFSYCRVSEVLGSTSAPSCTDPSEYRTAYFTPGAEVEVQGLAIGETTQVPVSLETRGLDPGQYNVLIEIDPPTGSASDGSVEERNEQNNTTAAQISILGPDLTVVDFRSEPESVVDRGGSVEVSATVMNIGVEPAGGFAVGFKLLRTGEVTEPVRIWSCTSDEATECIGPEYFGQARLPGIDVLVPEEVRCSLDTTGVEPGEYILRVEVDAKDDVAEHTEANNFAEIPLVITGEEEEVSEGADLAIDSLYSLKLGGGSNEVRMWATIVNQGDADAGPFDVSFFYVPSTTSDRVFLDPWTVDGLAAGERITVLRTFDASALARGRYPIGVIVDSEDEVVEVNEDNNVEEGTLWIH